MLKLMGAQADAGGEARLYGFTAKQAGISNISNTDHSDTTNFRTQHYYYYLWTGEPVQKGGPFRTLHPIALVVTQT